MQMAEFVRDGKIYQLSVDADTHAKCWSELGVMAPAGEPSLQTAIGSMSSPSLIISRP